MTGLFLRNRERLVAALAATTWAAPALAIAQGTVGRPTGVPDLFRDFPSAIRNGFNIVIILGGILFVILLLIGGVQYLASAGNEDSTKKARQLMLDAVIGLVIVVGAWAVGTYVLQLLGLSSGGLPTQPTSIQ